MLLNGSQSMHAVSDGGATVRSADGREALTVRSLDAPLISPGEPTPFPNGISRPVLDAGVHWNVMNNVWCVCMRARSWSRSSAQCAAHAPTCTHLCVVCTHVHTASD